MLDVVEAERQERNIEHTPEKIGLFGRLLFASFRRPEECKAELARSDGHDSSSGR